MKPNLNYDLQNRLFPRQVIIETGSICNLRCSICPYPNLKRKQGVMKEQIFRKIIDEISERDKKTTIWPAQLGEPLMLGDYFFSLINYAKRKDLRIILNTNGMLINKHLKILISGNLDEIIVGIDGITEKNYQKIRVGGDFEQVVSNVKLLLKEKPDSLKVTIQFIETEDNEREKKPFIDYWTGRGAIVKVRNKLGWGPTLPSSLNKYKIERVPCPWLMRTVVVHWNGNVVQCGGDCEERFPVGNIETSTLYQLWNGPLKSRRKKHNKGDFSFGPCRNCSDWACGIAERYYPDCYEGVVTKYAVPYEGRLRLRAASLILWKLNLVSILL